MFHLLLLLAGCGGAPTPDDGASDASTTPEAESALEIPFERYELDNGLDVILAPDHSTPVVHVNVWYHVGSGEEAEGLTGFAHLFEHLMFQGSENAPGEYFDPLEEVGASINGSTTSDRTNYFETLPAQYLPMALFMESDRMGALLGQVDQANLDNQRDVVRNERRQNYEIPPYGDVWPEIYAALYPEGHPYHHATIGSHEDLENASVEDVHAFFKKWYVPNNASLVVAGDFDPDVAKTLIEEQFGWIERGEDPVHVAPEPASLSEEVVVELSSEKVPLERLWLAWHSPAFYADGDAALDIFANLLSDGSGTRLHDRLVKTGLATRVRAYQSSRKHQSAFMIDATASTGHTTEELEAAIDEVLADVLGDSPPNADEVDAAVAQFELYFYGNITQVASKGDLLNQYSYYTGDPGFIGQDLERYLDLDEATVLAKAKPVLSAPRLEIHYRPEGGAE